LHLLSSSPALNPQKLRNGGCLDALCAMACGQGTKVKSASARVMILIRRPVQLARGIPSFFIKAVASKARNSHPSFISCLSMYDSAPSQSKANHQRRRKEEWRALHYHVYSRHRQTPMTKHDKKTRHVIAHAAQPSYSALSLKILAISL